MTRVVAMTAMGKKQKPRSERDMIRCFLEQSMPTMFSH
jgi:hypothetical protein